MCMKITPKVHLQYFQNEFSREKSTLRHLCGFSSHCVRSKSLFFGTQQQIISKRFWEIQKVVQMMRCQLALFWTYTLHTGEKSIFVKIVKFASNTTKMFEKISCRLKMKLVLKILKYVIGRIFNFLDLHVFCAKIQTI